MYNNQLLVKYGIKFLSNWWSKGASSFNNWLSLLFDCFCVVWRFEHIHCLLLIVFYRERIEREKAEKERAEKERAEKERAERERTEKERERIERERQERNRLEREQRILGETIQLDSKAAVDQHFMESFRVANQRVRNLL